MESTEDIEIDDEEIELYWEVSIYLVLGTFFSFIFWVFYIANRSFRSFLFMNLDYIHTTIELAILFWFFIAIPYFLFMIKLFWTLIKKLWHSYSASEIRLYLTMLRLNFTRFGFLTIIISMLFNIEYSNPINIGIGIGVLVFLNLFGIIDYTELKETERKKTESERRFKTLPEFNTIQGIGLIFIIIIIAFYSGSPEVKQFIDAQFEIILNDETMSIIALLTFLLSFLWFLVEGSIVVLLFVYEWISKKFDDSFKIIGFILIIYFLTKVFIFNVDQYAPPTYSTWISIGSSLFGGLITKYSKNIMDFIAKRRIRDD